MQNQKTSGRKQEKNLCDLEFSNAFTDKTLKAKSMKKKLMGDIKTKNFSSVKDIVKRIKRKTIGGRKYLQNTYIIQDLSPNIYKELFKSIRTNNIK